MPETAASALERLGALTDAAGCRPGPVMPALWGCLVGSY